MTDADLPALFCDADAAAARVQKVFYRVVAGVTFASIGSAFAPILGLGEPGTGIIQTFCFLLAFAGALYLAVGRPQKTWYGARALAESIKTMAWRFVLRAEPFDGDEISATNQFALGVTSLLRANREASALNFASAHAEFITKPMLALRRSEITYRAQVYSECRVHNQRDWYKRKARYNARQSQVWHSALIGVSFFAVLSALGRVGYREAWFVPVDAVAIFPVAILGWLQSKRFQELSSSYTLTAHEIAILGHQVSQIEDEDSLSKFVGDAENAFSREHTQWQARRDES